MSTEFSVKAVDGLELKAKTFLVPQGTPQRAKILFIHGFSEHYNAYDHWWPEIASRGYETTMFDQRGFGHTARTKDDHGVTNEYFAFKDIDVFIEKAYGDYKGPLFMWGHSMGGGIVLNYMVMGTYKDRFTGYIANSPLVRTHYTDWKAKLLPVLVKLMPFYREKLAIDFASCTNDPARQAAYKDDPLRTNMTSVALAYAMTNRGNRLLDPNFTKSVVDRPLLWAHGTNDFLCSYSAAKQVFESLKLSDKKSLTYPDFVHELMQLKLEDRQLFFKDVVAWLDDHTSTSSATTAPPPAPAAGPTSTAASLSQPSTASTAGSAQPHATATTTSAAPTAAPGQAQ